MKHVPPSADLLDLMPQHFIYSDLMMVDTPKEASNMGT